MKDSKNEAEQKFSDSTAYCHKSTKLTIHKLLTQRVADSLIVARHEIIFNQNNILEIYLSL